MPLSVRFPVKAFRRALVFALVSLPAVLDAQSAFTIPSQQCVYRAGDDPAWAAPVIDESGWRSLSAWTLSNAPLRYWIRCHADLSSLSSIAQPAVQISVYGALQLFVNGNPIGSDGDLNTGTFSMNITRSFPFPTQFLTPSLNNIAIRIGYPSWAPPVLRLSIVLPELRPNVEAGDREELRLSRSDLVLARGSGYLPIAICYEVIGVVAIMLFAPWLYDRSRSELLFLGIVCLSTAVLRLNEFCATTQMHFPFRAFLAVYVAGNILAPFAQTLVVFTLARRRMPIVFWIITGYVVMEFVVQGVELLFGISAPEWQSTLFQHLQPGLAQVARLTAPFVAFWPFRRIPPRMRLIAGVFVVNSVVELLWFGIQLTSTTLPIPGVPKIFVLWRSDLLEVRALAAAAVLISLLALLFREQRQITEESAVLAGEVQAARSVQQYLIPQHMPGTPGLAIESEYRPAREVGGDFFQVLPQAADDSLLVIIGDVAGKGVEAGMLATLIVGAVRTAAAFTSDPARILTLLNERLRGRGLVTCLALHIERDGTASMVNAGHLPPYLNGLEMKVEGALPLGAVPGITFPVSRFQLAEGDSLILMTDGVAEAQNAHGQLFGFDRIGELLQHGAAGAALADAAQHFGQQDDITILTLTFAPVGVVHA
jgi:serine phosphatase RsbU (regulator of sigma subunit)